MKKILFIIMSMAITAQSFSQGGNLLNNGFENWSTSTIYENPTDWGTSNYQEGAQFVNASKSSDAQHLNSSILLQNVSFDNGFGLDTTFGYCYQGYLGNQGPAGGIPYSTPVDRVNGYYKGTIGANDTAVVLVIKYLAGNMVSLDILPIFVSQTNWTAFTFPIASVAQDSIFIGFISTNPFANESHMSLSTAIKIDNVSLSHSVNGPGPALSNYSFENWVPVSSTTPNNWTTLNNFLAASGLDAVTQSSDANSGSSAARIETLAFNSDTLPGLLIYGNLVIGYQPTAVPYTASPTTFSGAYKFFPSNSDFGFISFELYSGGNVIGSNTVNMSASATYVPFSVSTNLTGTPDSVLVMCYTGNNPGSYAIVDDINFSGGNVSIDEIKGLNYSIYPNPTTDFINVNLNMEGSYDLSIFDINGKLVLTQTSSTSKSQVDVRNLSEGIYTMTVETNGSRLSKAVSIIR